MICASAENPPDALMWHDALVAKYDGVGQFGRKEWDQLLGDCQVSIQFYAPTSLLNSERRTNESIGGMRLAGLCLCKRVNRGLS